MALKSAGNRVAGVLDRIQRRYSPIGFVYAVIQKFLDDRAGNLAALITYFAFFSVFPLLLALTTILGFVLSGHPELRQTVYTSAVADLPIIGEHSTVNPLEGNGFALTVGLTLAIWSGIQVARNAQTAFNIVYSVSRVGGPGFIPRILRALELVTVGGLGLILTTFLQGVVSGTDKYGLHIGWLGQAAAAIVGIAANFLLFSYLFRRLTVYPLSAGDVAPGALTAAVLWVLLQKVGTGLVNDKVNGSVGTYGTFAVVIGLMFWFYVLSLITLICAEINVVRTERLWPRGLSSINRRASTRADVRAYRLYPRRENQGHNVGVVASLWRLRGYAGDPYDDDDPYGSGPRADAAAGGDTLEAAGAGGGTGASGAAEAVDGAPAGPRGWDVAATARAPWTFGGEDAGPPTQPLPHLPIRPLPRNS